MKTTEMLDANGEGDAHPFPGNKRFSLLPFYGLMLLAVGLAAFG